MDRERRNKYLLKERNQFQIPQDLEIRDYQQKAINNWKNNGFCGVYDMATGTGKTITAILSLYILYEHLEHRLGVVILCPYQHLVKQWLFDLEYFGIDAIVGYSGSPYGDFVRQLESQVIQFNRNKENFFVFISTNDTFRKKEIQYILKMFTGKLLLIADEAHNLGANINSKYLTDKFDFRLGLSATFERHWDKTGTRVLYHFFGKKVFSYTLKEAIENQVLVPYEYHPVICSLTDEEYEQYIELSMELRKYVIWINGEAELSEKGKVLLIERAKVVAAAFNKLEELNEIMKRYKYDDSMLVYCGAANIFGTEIKQLDYVNDMLKRNHNMIVKRFTCNETMKERSALLEELENKSIQVLSAIKCLDEGVNVPSIKTAFILASANNPKEYIQRRGRVLRKAPGKEKAVIYDFVTLPYKQNGNPNEIKVSGTKYDLSLVKRELVRMKYFGELAINRREVEEIQKQIMNLFHIKENERMEEEAEDDE